MKEAFLPKKHRIHWTMDIRAICFVRWIVLVAFAGKAYYLSFWLCLFLVGPGSELDVILTIRLPMFLVVE